MIFDGKIKVSDYEKVVAVVNMYVEDCREGKSDIMYGYLNGELSAGSIENLYGAVDQFGADLNTKARVDVLSIEGTAATVRVTLEDWHGIAFTDFHSLLKIDGEWKIIAKVFYQY
ncbi:nuclear transport factor 2 family protein [Thomasclavelia spiroformis]|uniref:nuclear transport factor 2 family protein n=1 Tax=Thomasclavelia spiroformis TaxID=29348 RepID=UPI0039965EF8